MLLCGMMLILRCSMSCDIVRMSYTCILYASFRAYLQLHFRDLTHPKHIPTTTSTDNLDVILPDMIPHVEILDTSSNMIHDKHGRSVTQQLEIDTPQQTPLQQEWLVKKAMR